jgi:ABC-type bacteriocin/lantibiotic exporter with double-glycine peptidase domain
MASVIPVSIGSSLRKFHQVIMLDKKDISAIYVFAFMAGIVQLSLPLGIQTIIGFVMAGSVSTSIVVLISMVVIGTFLNGLLQVRQLEIIEKLKQKIFLRYGLEFSDRLPRLDNEKLDGYYLPELVNRFFDTVSLQKGLEKLLLELPAAIIQILLGLLLLSFYHPVFIGFGIMLIAIILLILYYTSPQGLALALKSSDFKYKVAGWLQETARVVKSFKYSKSRLHILKTDAFVGGHLDARTSYFKILLIQFWSLISFKVIVTAAMLIVGTILLVNQQINVGQFIAADIVIIAIIGSVEKLIVSLDKVYDALVSIEKLGTITEAETEAGGELMLGKIDNGVAVKFVDASFSYPDGKKILDQLSFEIQPGQVVHISGKSGSGKSSLLRLLTGTYKNFEGNILIDGQGIGSYDIESMRNQTGLLLDSQDIFTGTILENMTMGNAEINITQVTDYVAKLGLEEFVQSDKLGLYRILDPVGKRLSKDIRKKILLVRALLGHHRLLLLEEPFEHLDESTIAMLSSILGKMKSTTVFITSSATQLPLAVDAIVDLGNAGKLKRQ